MCEGLHVAEAYGLGDVGGVDLLEDVLVDWRGAEHDDAGGGAVWELAYAACGVGSLEARHLVVEDDDVEGLGLELCDRSGAVCAGVRHRDAAARQHADDDGDRRTVAALLPRRRIEGGGGRNPITVQEASRRTT